MEARRRRRGRGQQRRELEGVVVRVGALGRKWRSFIERSHGARAAAVSVVVGAQPAAGGLEEEAVEGLKVA